MKPITPLEDIEDRLRRMATNGWTTPLKYRHAVALNGAVERGTRWREALPPLVRSRIKNAALKVRGIRLSEEETRRTVEALEGRTLIPTERHRHHRRGRFRGLGDYRVRGRAPRARAARPVHRHRHRAPVPE